MIDQLKFDANGLIPAVVQDYFTKKVLTTYQKPAFIARLALPLFSFSAICSLTHSWKFPDASYPDIRPQKQMRCKA